MKRTTRRLVLVPLATAVALVAPATASAAVRCVNFSGGDCFSGLTYTSIQNAVDAAANGDTIRLKPQSYTESVNADSKTLTFDSPGAATINGLADLPVLSMAHGGAVRGLTLTAGEKSGSGGTAQAGIRFASTGSYSLTLSGVVVTGGLGTGGGTNGGPGLEVTNGNNAGNDTRVGITSSTIGAGSSSAPGGDGLLFAALGGRLSMSGSTVRGPDAAGSANGLHVIGAADATVTGSLLQGEHGATIQNAAFTGVRDRFVTDPSNSFGAGLDVLSTSDSMDAAANRPTTATVADSLVEATPTGNLGNSAAYVSPGLATARLTARGSTFVAEKPDNTSGAVEVRGFAGDAAGSAALTNSIVRALDGPTGSADLVAERGTITADHTSFSSSVSRTGGSSPAAGSGTNISGDPRFVSATNYALQPGSPLIDRGDPSVVSAGELDFAGKPRSLDGNGDCASAPDIGALELVGPVGACSLPPATNVAPLIGAFGATNKVFAPAARGGRITAATAARHRRKKKVKRGTRFRYTLSEAAKVTITIDRRLTGRRVTKGRGKARKTVCATPTRKNAKRRRCTRYRRAGTIRASGRAGRNTTAFTGRFKGKALTRGRYRATIVATDAQGAKSKPKRLSLRIVAP